MSNVVMEFQIINSGLFTYCQYYVYQ